MAAAHFTNCTCAVLEKSSSSKPFLLMPEELCCKEQPKAATGGFAVSEQWGCCRSKGSSAPLILQRALAGEIDAFTPHA